MAAMTPEQYLALLEEDLYFASEAAAERKAEYRNEVALYGDAGPGMGLSVSEDRAELERLQAKIAKVRRLVAARASRTIH